MPPYSKRNQLARKKKIVCKYGGCKIKVAHNQKYCALHSKRGIKSKSGSRLSAEAQFKFAKTAFQLMVRLRDANSEGFVRCCSCSRTMNWKSCDGGHYFPAHRRATCFDSPNVNGQCKVCNLNMNDPKVLNSYTNFMRSKYGSKTLSNLEIKSRMDSGYDAYSFQLIRFKACLEAEKLHLEKFGTELDHNIIRKPDYVKFKAKL